MPPKPKEKKEITTVARPSISSSTLVQVPENVLEGYQERIETGVDWVVTELAARHHKEKCLREDIQFFPFSQALQYKKSKSVLNGFLDENSKLSLQEQWEIILPMVLFDNQRSNEEGQICFRSDNSITDNLFKVIQRAVVYNDRVILKKGLREALLLRVNNSKMTNLDEGLLEFSRLLSLNVSNNYIAELQKNVYPRELKFLELQGNRISNLRCLTRLPNSLLHLGLSRNLMNDESNIQMFERLPPHLISLDIADNDIYHLAPLIEALANHKKLTSLNLSGNPCAMSLGYAKYVFSRMHILQFLDNRTLLDKDHIEPHDPHTDDLRSTYFVFNVLRIMSAPCPPKQDKGATAAFHVELELPLLDATRRMFLMFRHNESLIEMLPPPEDYSKSSHENMLSEHETAGEESQGDIFTRLEAKNSREIRHYTTFESNKVPWNTIMNFQDPTIRIFCPDLTAIRNTFRSVITVSLVYTLTQIPSKNAKTDKKMEKKSSAAKLEQRAVIATIKCALKPCDWSQSAQYFHWDDSLPNNEALHWGDGDLSVLQYSQGGVKQTKGKPESKGKADIQQDFFKQPVPTNLTCHFSFGIETLYPH